MEITQKINYETRRDLAISTIAENLLDRPSGNLPIAELASLLSKWKDADIEDDSIDDIVTALTKCEDHAFISANLTSIEQILSRGLLVTSPWLRVGIASRALILLRRSGQSSGRLYAQAVNSLDAAWESIGDPAAKLTAGYQISGRLADYDREVALDYLRRTDVEKRGYTDLASSTYLLCLRIVIRSFSGLLPRRLSQSTDIDRIGILIDRVPNELQRVQLWTDLILRAHRRDHHDLSRDLVRQRLNPLLSVLKARCLHERRVAMVCSAPALYCFSPVVADQNLGELSLEYRDEAYDNLTWYLVTEMPPGEPFNRHSGIGLHLGEEKCAEVLKVARNLNSDFLVYKYILLVAEAARWQHNRVAPNQHQRNQLAKTIRDLSGNKFPNPRCITHDGFAILAEAQAMRLLRAKDAEWSDLIKRGQNLSNLSDRAFVIMHLADIMHSTFLQERNTLFDEAYEVALTIPCLREKLERLNNLANLMQNHNPPRAKAIIKEAVAALPMRHTDASDETCRDLVDLAYQLDPEFASFLSSVIDGDRGRAIARRQIAFQKMKERWKDDSQPSERDETLAKERGEKVARNLLGTLNADRIPQKSFKSCVEILSTLHGSSLRSQFWTFSWALENLFEKRSSSGEAESPLREVFESALKATEVGAAIISRAAGQTISLAPASMKGEDSIVIKAGQREKALSYLANWLRDHGSRFLYICDPYFGRGELEALQLVLQIHPKIKVRVLTGRRKQEQDLAKEPLPIQDAYQVYWRQHFSEQNPEDCEIVIIGNLGGDLPIHERWWLTDGAGIRVGTSFNQLGVNRDSEIGVLKPNEVEERMQEIEALISRQKKDHLGQRLTYQVVPL